MYRIKEGNNLWLENIHLKRSGADERFYQLPSYCPYSTEYPELAKQYSSLEDAFIDIYKILDYNNTLRPVIEEIT